MLHHFPDNRKAPLTRPAPTNLSCQSLMTMARTAFQGQLSLHQSREPCGRKVWRRWRLNQVLFLRARAPPLPQGPADLLQWKASATCLKILSTLTCLSARVGHLRTKIRTPWQWGAGLSQLISWGRGVEVEAEEPRFILLTRTRQVCSLFLRTRETARGEVMTVVTPLTSFHLTALTHTSQTHRSCSWAPPYCTTATAPRPTYTPWRTRNTAPTLTAGRVSPKHNTEAWLTCIKCLSLHYKFFFFSCSV